MSLLAQPLELQSVCLCPTERAAPCITPSLPREIFSRHEAVIQSQAQAHVPCPLVAACKINNFSSIGAVPSPATSLHKINWSSWFVWNLHCPAGFGQYWQLCQTFAVQGPGTASLLSWGSLVLSTKKPRKWAFTGAVNTSSPLSAFPPTRKVSETQTHTHAFLSLKATTRRQSLTNELLKQSCSVIMNVIKVLLWLWKINTVSHKQHDRKR